MTIFRICRMLCGIVSAIALTFAAFDLGSWMLGALFTVFAFVSSLKSAIERMTLRVLRHRRERRLQQFAALSARG